MALSNYAELVQEITQYLERDDLATQIDTFIDLAEARHRREIRYDGMLKTATVTLTAGNSTAPLPADFLDIKHLRLDAPNTYQAWRYSRDFLQVTRHQMAEIATTVRGCPRRFTVSTELEFDCAADQDYTMDLLYYSALTSLDSINTTNDLLTNHPDAYLYGALASSAPFLMHDERLQIWEAMYRQVKDGIDTMNTRNKWGGPLVSRVQGAPSPWR